MKIRYLKLKNWVLVTLMGAMGLTGCHCHKKAAKSDEAVKPDPEPEVVRRGENMLMYGVPTMQYMIRGQVRDAEGRPVRDIRLNMLERNMETTPDGKLDGDPEAVRNWLEKTSVSTDEQGRFELKGSGLPQEQVRLMVRDVDGQENGAYKDRVVEMEVTPDRVDRTHAGGWNQGTFNGEVEIELESR